MKIGHYVSVVAGQKGFEQNVSGHIQVPMHAMQLLEEAGHENHLITNEFDDDRSMPMCLPSKVQVHFVPDARNRGGVLERTAGEGSGIKLTQLRKQIIEIKRICKEQKLDVLHLYGYNRTAHLAGGLRMMGLKIPVVVTIFATFFPERFSFIKRRLWNRVDAVVTATSHIVHTLENEHIPVTQLKHGVMRDLVAELHNKPVNKPSRVLFWRDLTKENGADLALAAYDVLAPNYPEVSFEFAVRKHWNELQNVERIVEKHPNVVLRRFPYEDGVSISRLLLESICVVMPIRDISINPQLVIVETLAAGIPIITTDYRSNPELVQNGVTGVLVPLDDPDAIISALDRMLSNPTSSAQMGDCAKEFIASNWNWDKYVEEVTKVYRRVIG